MNAHDLLATLASDISKCLSSWFGAYLPPGYQHPFFGKIFYADLLSALFILLFTFIIHGSTSIFIHGKIKTARQDQKETKQHVFLASTKPLYLLIWTIGFYFALVPLMVKLPAEATLPRIILDKLLDLGIGLNLLWFIMRLTWILEARLAAWAAKSKTRLDDLLVPLLGRTLRIIIPVLGIIFMLPILGLPARYADALAKGSSILIILAVASILIESVNVGEKILIAENDLTLADNLRARKIYTQVKLLGKALHVAIGLCTIAIILMLFQEVRHVGTSLLASAGIVGIIAGIAAQQTLANLFAGFQI